MNIKDYGISLKNKVDEILSMQDVSSQTRLNETYKDNGVKYHTLMVGPENGRIYTNTYYDEYYEMYCAGTKELDEAAEEICKIYIGNIDKIMGLNDTARLEELSDWEYIKDKVSIMLLNSELNRKYLSEMPHKTPEGMEDLSVIYYVRLSEDMSFKVTNSLLEKLGISADELDKAAYENSEGIMQPSVTLISDVVKEMIGEEKFESIMVGEEGYEPEMYVVTNRENINGASAIMLDGIKKRLNDLANGRELFIIPSSKHEVLVMPDNGYMPVEEIKDMVYQVNCEEISTNDFLSNNVYKYNPKTMKIRKVTSEPIIEERRQKISR